MDFYFFTHSLESFLLIASILIVLSLLSSKPFSRFGLPSLLLFLILGMLVGSEGPGGIEFDDHSLTLAIGSLLLSLILFNGGLTTDWKEVRPVSAPGISLATVGVILTALLTAIFVKYLLGLTWVEGALLGAIISSTDAPAVFSALRSQNLSLQSKVKHTLELEAGSNDPMAVFLTIGFLEFCTNPQATFFEFFITFMTQLIFGFGIGLIGAKIFKSINNWANFEHQGQYGVLSLSLLLLVFSSSFMLGGSGFLAAYIAGLFLGNSKIAHKGTILKFHESIAWLSQISLFILLGLLVYPSHLIEVWQEGLLLCVFIILIGRPVSVFLSTPYSGLNLKEKIFTSWVGLRGAAPILLATLPWSENFPKAEYFFNLVFFVVLFSVIIQGATIPFLARHLGVVDPISEEEVDPDELAIHSEGYAIIELTVEVNSEISKVPIAQARLPRGTWLTSIRRSERFITPKGDTLICPDDKIRALVPLKSLNDFKKACYFLAKN